MRTIYCGSRSMTSFRIKQQASIDASREWVVSYGEPWRKSKLSELIENAGHTLSWTVIHSADGFLKATSTMPHPDVWWDSEEEFVVIEWDRGPGRMFTLKIANDGFCHWAVSASGQRRCGKFEYVQNVPSSVIEAVKLVN